MAVSIVSGALASLFVIDFLPKSDNQMIKEFYSTETVVSVSPSDFINDLEKGQVDGLLVDLRTSGEYNAGHLVTAINIPAGQMTVPELIAAYQNLPKDKPIISYCYSSYCMLSRKAGKVLADNGLYVKHLTAGWYEINRDFSAFIVNGSEPGTLNASQHNAPSSTCSITVVGGLTC